jgi:hypothetical protein
MSIKSIILTTVAVSSIFFFAPSEHTVTHEMTIRSGSTINTMVMQAAEAEGIDTNSVDLNESRDITIHESGVDAGNLKPGSTVKVTVVYRK